MESGFSFSAMGSGHVYDMEMASRIATHIERGLVGLLRSEWAHCIHRSRI